MHDLILGHAEGAPLSVVALSTDGSSVSSEVRDSVAAKLNHGRELRGPLSPRQVEGGLWWMHSVDDNGALLGAQSLRLRTVRQMRHGLQGASSDT